MENRESPTTPQAGVSEPTVSLPPAGAPATEKTVQAPSRAPEPTQAMQAAPDTNSADILLKDAERRRQLEQDLARMGMSPDEVRRLLNADAHTSEPAPSAPAPRPALPAVPFPPMPTPTPAASKSNRVTADTLASFAAELQSKKAEEQQIAIEAAAVTLPEFRESSVQEKMKAETLLREASLMRRGGKYRDAEQKCREALALVPKEATGLELLGDILQGTGRVDEALAAYKRGMEADPKRGQVERKYGDLLMRQQNWGGVDLEAVPTNGHVGMLLSLCLPGLGQVHNGDWPKAIFFLLADAICAYLIFWSPWGLKGGHRGSGLSTSAMIVFGITGVIYILAAIDTNIGLKGRKRAPAPDGWRV